jgi:hypothetical protein
MLKIQCSRERSLYVKGKINSNYAIDKIIKAQKRLLKTGNAKQNPREGSKNNMKCKIE